MQLNAKAREFLRQYPELYAAFDESAVTIGATVAPSAGA